MPSSIPWPSSSTARLAPRGMGLVLGEEDRGIDPEWLSRCTRSVTIPMRKGAGSLNVAVAAGILLYRLTHDARMLEAPFRARP